MVNISENESLLNAVIHKALSKLVKVLTVKLSGLVKLSAKWFQLMENY